MMPIHKSMRRVGGRKRRTRGRMLFAPLDSKNAGGKKRRKASIISSRSKEEGEGECAK